MTTNEPSPAEQPAAPAAPASPFHAPGEEMRAPYDTDRAPFRDLRPPAQEPADRAQAPASPAAAEPAADGAGAPRRSIDSAQAGIDAALAEPVGPPPAEPVSAAADTPPVEPVAPTGPPLWQADPTAPPVPPRVREFWSDVHPDSWEWVSPLRLRGRLRLNLDQVMLVVVDDTGAGRARGKRVERGVDERAVYAELRMELQAAIGRETACSDGTPVLAGNARCTWCGRPGDTHRAPLRPSRWFA